jgi:hypothetical protein
MTFPPHLPLGLLVMLGPNSADLAAGPVDWPRFTVMGCEGGALVGRQRRDPGDPGGPVLRLGLTDGRPVLPRRCRALVHAERLRFAGLLAQAEGVYRGLAERRDGEPEWVAAVAGVRLVALAVARGDPPTAADALVALRKLPGDNAPAAVAALPERIECRDARLHDAAVERLHGELFAALRAGEPPEAAAPLTALLSRLDLRVPEPPTGTGFFGRGPPPAEGGAVWVLDGGSFTERGWSAVVAEVVGSLHRLRPESGHRFAVVTGPLIADRYPPGPPTEKASPAGTGPADAAERFLRRPGAMGYPTRREWEATLRAAEAVASAAGLPLVVVSAREPDTRRWIDSALRRGLRAEPADLRRLFPPERS